MKNIIIALLVVGVIGGFGAAAFVSAAEVPDTIQEAKEETEAAAKNIASGLTGAVKNIWNNEVVPMWQGMFNWTKEVLWDKYILGFFEKRKPVIEQELDEEKQEIKEEVKVQASKAWQDLWSRFKALFQ